MTNKQKKVLQTIEWFMPPNYKGSMDTMIGLVGVQEQKSGVSADEAFFMKTDHGELTSSVHDKERLKGLLWGQRHMAMHVKMWKEGFAEGSLHPYDFIQDPEYIQSIARECCEAVGRSWKDDKGRLVGWEMGT